MLVKMLKRRKEYPLADETADGHKKREGYLRFLEKRTLGFPSIRSFWSSLPMKR